MRIAVTALRRSPSLSVALAGCGGSTKPAATTAPTLREAVAAYSNALLSGHGDAARKLLSSRCRARLSRSEMHLNSVVAKNLFGPEPIKTLTIVSLSGSMARVTYTYKSAGLDQTREPWVKEHGRWLVDDC